MLNQPIKRRETHVEMEMTKEMIMIKKRNRVKTKMTIRNQESRKRIDKNAIVVICVSKFQISPKMLESKI